MVEACAAVLTSLHYLLSPCVLLYAFCAAHPPYNLVYALQVLENPTLLSNTRPAKPGSRSLGSSANTSSKGGCC
jgi:hypothetical protein